MSDEEIILKRSVEAVQIPYGAKMGLPAGSRVVVRQVLGGNYTVVTEEGMLVRIDARDADALGKTPTEAPAAAPPPPPTEIPPGMPADQAEIVKKVWDELRTVYDPEIPVNVVELGLIYEMSVIKLPTEGFGVDVKMSLTAPGCGMGPILAEDARAKLMAIPGVKAANVEVVFDPPWDPSRMTEAARLTLGLI